MPFWYRKRAEAGPSPFPGDGPSRPAHNGQIPQEQPPPYPIQYIFIQEDVLDSKVVEAQSQTVFCSTYSPTPTQTIINDGQGVPLLSIAWNEAEGPSLSFNFAKQSFKIAQWLHRVTKTDELFKIDHRDQVYEVFQAGSALGIRKARTSIILAGIRDPYKNVEIVLSPEGVAIPIQSYLFASPSLSLSRVSARLEWTSRSEGRDTVLDVGPSAGVGKDYKKFALRRSCCCQPPTDTGQFCFQDLTWSVLGLQPGINGLTDRATTSSHSVKLKTRGIALWLKACTIYERCRFSFGYTQVLRVSFDYSGILLELRTG